GGAFGNAHPAQVVDRTRNESWLRAQCHGLRAERRYAAARSRSEHRRWSLAGGNDRSELHEVLLEAVQLHLEQRDTGRAYARFARYRRERQGAADSGRDAGETHPLGKLCAVPAYADDCLKRRAPLSLRGAHPSRKFSLTPSRE